MNRRYNYNSSSQYVRYYIPFLRYALCFTECRGSCLMCSVTGAGKWQPGGGPWQMSKVEMKAQAAWREMCIFSDERWTEAQHTGDGHRGCPNQTHISNKSHLLDRDSLTQSLGVPEEPADSSSTRPHCIEPQQQVLQAHFEGGCYHSISILSVVLCSWRNVNVLKELEGKGMGKWLLTSLCLDLWDAIERINNDMMT